MPHFTPTEQRMLDILSDGQRHTMTELHAVLDDELQPRIRVAAHIYNIRQKLKPLYQRIVCEFDRGRYYYCHVRMLCRPDD